MKEIPILFSTPMVQAILEGRKTQTRRAAAVPYGDHHGTDIMDWHLSKHPHFEYGKWWYNVQSDVDSYNTFELKAKYGRPGDLLWVRETWGIGSRPNPFEGSIDGIEFKADAKYLDDIELLPLYTPEGFDFEKYERAGWRPSIHMPKAAARIWLQVTDVRVERLQDISEEDAIAEGSRPRSHSCGGFGYYEAGGDIQDCICQKWDREPKVMGFFDLWSEINGKDSLDANPWVWAISFKVLSTTGRPNV